MQTIPIDFSSSAPLPPIRAMQGDAYSRFVRFELWEGGAPYTIPEGAAYKIGYRLRGGLEGAYDTIPLPGGSSRPACVAEGSAITAELAEVLTVDGNTGQLVLVITGPDGYKIHSWEVPLLVGAASGAPATDPSLDGLGQLTTAAVAKAQAAQQAAEKAADSAAASAAEASQSAANAAESEAAAAESARKAEASEPASAAQRAEAAAQQAEKDSDSAAKSASQAALAALAASQSESSSAQSAAKAEESARRAESVTFSGNPSGAVIWYAGETPPEGYLICNGASISRSAYSALFAVIGTTFGEGDGETTFAVPDLHAKIIEGNRLTIGKADTFMVGEGSRLTRTLTLLPCIKY